MPRKASAAVVATLFLIFLYLYGSPRFSSSLRHDAPLPFSTERPLACRQLPGAEDVVVVIKTGSTEFQDKFVVHINTTLTCYPRSLVFSDYAETYEGIQIIDALESIDDKIKQNNPDFDLWRRLQDGGRSVLLPEELSGPVSASHASKYGNTGNPGWKLDKWKFLPMATRTLQEYPDAKWYLFVEVDTLIFWQTLLNYLPELNSDDPIYMGSMIMLQTTHFAHGGTGFVLSRPALEMMVEKYQAERAFWDQYVENTWAGDAVLGAVLREVGAHFINARAIFQGEEIGNVPYERDDWWCTPTVSYHHLAPVVVEDMWRFEQAWIAGTKGNSSKILRHQDVFDEYILPRVMSQPSTGTADWTNNAGMDQGPVESLDACRSICMQHTKCLQFMLDEQTRCKTSEVPRLGEMAKGVSSGWLVDRIKSWRESKSTCSDRRKWIVDRML